MKNLLFIFLFLLIPLKSLLAQDSKNVKIEQRDAFYPDGKEALIEHVFYGIKYSEKAKEERVQDQVAVLFFVNPDSSLSNIRVVRDPGFGIGENVKQILEMVKFAPALQNGIPVKSQVILNIPVRAH